MLAWERWRVPRSVKDETNAPRCYINIRGEWFSGPGIHPRFFIQLLALPRKLKLSNYFDASARPGLEPDSNEFFARTSPQFALSPRVKPVRSAQRTVDELHPDRAIYPWSIPGITILNQADSCWEEANEGENEQGKRKSERDLSSFPRNVNSPDALSLFQCTMHLHVPVTNVLSHQSCPCFRKMLKIIISKSFSQTNLIWQ